MSLRAHWFVTLLLTALGATMGGAHLLELPVRMHYEPLFYTRVTSTLYRYYGLVGGPIQILAVVAAVTLLLRSRSAPSFRVSLVATVSLGVSLVLWAALVQPVNSAWLEALREGDAVDAYMRLRSRWEYGHVAAYLAWIFGFVLLLHSALRYSPHPSALPTDST